MTNQLEKNDLHCLPRFFGKGLCVLAVAGLLCGTLNGMMQRFLDDEVAVVTAAAERAAAIQQALNDAGESPEAIRLAAELAVKKAEQYEQFYQKYKNRFCYHYYGQFYEMFENQYNADTIFIGTSHTAHGVNPKYIEEENPDRSFFNFALNGSNPQYYLDWWEVFLESGYPIPETIVYCVDWFMCDDGWLWRRIDFDTNPDCPVDIMRKIVKAEKRQASKNADSESAADSESVAASESTAASDTDALENDSEKTKLPWWNVDEVLTYAFNRIPLIYSRDRIPEMLSYYAHGGKIELAEESAVEGETTEQLPEVPVYRHEYLTDSDGNITSEFYKGFEPWERTYDGTPMDQGCNDNPAQWEAFEALLDLFAEYGIHIVLVEVPEYVPGRNEWKMEENNARIAEIAADRGLTFYNYNGERYSAINDDYTCFSDWGHMNYKGSTAFSKMLAADLAEYFAGLE